MDSNMIDVIEKNWKISKKFYSIHSFHTFMQEKHVQIKYIYKYHDNNLKKKFD